MGTNTHVFLIAPGAGVGGRVPVLACADALRDGGATVEVVEVDSHREVTAALERAAELDAKLVVAGGDGQLRSVVRQQVRLALPRGGQRPADMPANRTIADLTPVGVLPLDPDADDDLAAALRLPRKPIDVATAVLAGRGRRLDLFRHDGGSVTLRSALLGGVDKDGKPAPWTAAVQVDDTVLSNGDEPLIAVGVSNVGGLDALPGLPLTVAADATNGQVTVGIAVATADRSWLRRRRPGVEVRRAVGRAVAIIPTGATEGTDVPVVDDGVHASVNRKRTWWVEPGAWAAYVS